MFLPLIVDDEPIHTIGLSKYVDWSKCGYEKPLTCGSSDEAIELVKEQQIEVIFADINMPEKNGLQMIREIMMLNLATRPEIIIISGHDEFNYAKEAISLGVRAYLLKPLKVEEVEEWLIKIRKEKELVQKFSLKNIRYNVDITLNLLLKEYINTAKLPSLFELDLPEQYGFFKDSFFAFVMLFRVNSDLMPITECIELINRTVIPVFNDVAYSTLIDLKYNEILFLACDTEADKLTFGQKILSAYNFERPVYINFSMALEKIDFSSIYSLYYKVYIELENKDLDVTFSNLIKDFKKAIENKNPDLLIETSTALLRLPQDIDFVSFKAACLNIAVFYIDFIKEKNAVHKLKELTMTIRRDEVEDIMKFYESKFLEAAEKQDKMHFVVQRAMDFIKEHYSEDIKAYELAEKYNINYSYFSILFKKETGVNLSDYITDYRIQCALDLLLNTNTKICEIAKLVGYTTPAYFTDQFKKRFGRTPKEIRRSGKL